jgi:cobalt/nickel transport system permease protein
MHIPDGFLDPKMSGGLLGLAAGVLGYCLGKVMKAVTAVVPNQVLATIGNGIGNIQTAGRRVLTKIGQEKLYQMGTVAAWVFAAQMFNFPINSGTSGHLLGGAFAAVILGPFAGAVVIAAVLSVQSIFFADGGLMALGANIINMAVIGSFLSYYVYIFFKECISEFVGIIVASWLSVVFASLACAVEIGLSGTISLHNVTLAMVKTHCIIGIAEAIITVIMLRIYNREIQS